MLNNVNEDPEEGNEPEKEGEDSGIGSHSGNRYRRRRIKVRKRVRVKNRRSPRKKARKFVEVLIWLTVIAAFISTLILLVKQLDLNSDKRKGKKTTQLNTNSLLPAKDFSNFYI